MDFPIDLKKPSKSKRRVAGHSVAEVKQKLLDGHKTWKNEAEAVLSSDAEDAADAEDATDEYELRNSLTVEVVGDKNDH